VSASASAVSDSGVVSDSNSSTFPALGPLSYMDRNRLGNLDLDSESGVEDGRGSVFGSGERKDDNDGEDEESLLGKVDERGGGGGFGGDREVEVADDDEGGGGGLDNEGTVESSICGSWDGGGMWDSPVILNEENNGDEVEAAEAEEEHGEEEEGAGGADVIVVEDYQEQETGSNLVGSDGEVANDFLGTFGYGQSLAMEEENQKDEGVEDLEGDDEEDGKVKEDDKVEVEDVELNGLDYKRLYEASLQELERVRNERDSALVELERLGRSVYNEGMRFCEGLGKIREKIMGIGGRIGEVESEDDEEEEE
jgi:hypothetical protein